MTSRPEAIDAGSSRDPVVADPIDDPIYMDHHATTPVDDRVLEAMLPYFGRVFGNPASGGHAYGWAAEAAVVRSRQRLAAAIGAQPDELIFTSGATEANNLAIKGVAEAQIQRGRHIVTVATEHRAVLDPCRYLANLGFELTVLPVQGDGLVDLAVLAAALRPDTILVSVMAANNEIGVLQPLAAIGDLCHDRPQPILFHTDAAQAIGKIPLNVEALQVDLMSITAHKAYGPKGVGALYVRRSAWRRGKAWAIAPQIHGGGQEQGQRSGTLNVPLIVGFAEAIDLAIDLMPSESVRVRALRDRLWQHLDQANQPDTPGRILQNGHPEARLPGNLNISLGSKNGAKVLADLRPIVALSSGSACSSESAGGEPRPSHVLIALGRSPAQVIASLRFGLGRWTTTAEIDRVARATLASIGLSR